MGFLAGVPDRRAEKSMGQLMVSSPSGSGE